MRCETDVWSTSDVARFATLLTAACRHRVFGDALASLQFIREASDELWRLSYHRGPLIDVIAPDDVYAGVLYTAAAGEDELGGKLTPGVFCGRDPVDRDLTVGDVTVRPAAWAVAHADHLLDAAALDDVMSG
jgi:hypothetical protein